MKKILTLILLLGSTTLIVGCGMPNNASQTSGRMAGDSQERGSTSTESNFMGRGFGGMNFTTGTAVNLVVGEKVVVMGVTNSDSSVGATRIMLGEFPEVGMRTGTPPRAPEGGAASSSDAGGRGYGRRVGGAGQVGAGRVASSQSRVSGEIIKKDDISLVVKLPDGGSKLIFYSDKMAPQFQVLPFPFDKSDDISMIIQPPMQLSYLSY